MGNARKITSQPASEAGRKVFDQSPPDSSERQSIYHQFQALKPGDHLCILYENPLDWTSSITPLILTGLEQNQKCIYVTDAHTEHEVLDCLNSNGRDMSSYLASGQLLVMDQSEVYTRDACFDPDRMINLLKSETKKALKQGYSALRVTGEMSWALNNIKGADRLCEYESRLNSDLFENHPCLAVCQYDLSRFDVMVIKEALKSHPHIIYKDKVLDNCYYVPPPDEFSGQSRDVNEIRYCLKHLEQQKARQLQMKSSEEKYQTLFETTGISLCMLDDKGTVKLVNNHWEKTLGYNREEVEGKMHFTQFIHPDEVERLQVYCDSRLELPKAVPEEYETQVIDKAGNTRCVIFNVQMILGSKNRIVSALDVTELRESGDQYRALVDLSGEVGESILMLQDIDGREGVITFASHQFSSMTGYSIKELLGKQVFDLLSPKDREASIDRHRRKMRGESLPGLYEVTIIRKDGSEVPCELTSAVTNYRGEPSKIVYLRDITERKQAEKGLAAAYEGMRKLSNRLQRVREEERQHISCRLHDEVGQMLTAIKIDLVWLSKQMPAEQKKLVDKTQAVVKMLDATSQITRGISAELRPKLLDELGLVEAISWHCREFNKATGLECTFVSNLKYMIEDRDINVGLFRIFQELLTNAFRHAEATRVTVNLKKKDDILVLRMEDNGRGISQEQISAPCSLGLLGIKERVYSINGTFSIRGCDKRGTTVSVSVPLKAGRKQDVKNNNCR